MNSLEKLHALLTSDQIWVWHFPYSKELTKFVYWVGPATAQRSNENGNWFETLEGMIDAAYAEIDPLRKELPEKLVDPRTQI